MKGSDTMFCFFLAKCNVSGRLYLRIRCVESSMRGRLGQQYSGLAEMHLILSYWRCPLGAQSFASIKHLWCEIHTVPNSLGLFTRKTLGNVEVCWQKHPLLFGEHKTQYPAVICERLGLERIACSVPDLVANIGDEWENARLENLQHNCRDERRVPDMNDQRYSCIGIQVETDEKHDDIPRHNLEVLVVDDDRAFALVLLRQTQDGFDNIAKIAGCCEEELEVALSAKLVLVFGQLQHIKSGNVPPMIPFEGELLGYVPLIMIWRATLVVPGWHP